MKHSLTELPNHRISLVAFSLSLLLYAFTRLYALEDFPIYFFTDEAVHPVYGVELAQNGFRDAAQNFLPAYFQNGQSWNLSLSVYLHALTASLFGKTIFVTRATSAIVSIIGVAAVALMLKWIFQIRAGWLAILFLAITPAWFLHSRTAFETVLMVSFYACFLLFYLLYRYRAPRFIFPALVFGAATFYSYSNGQSVMLVSGILFLISDWRYHFQNRRLLFWALGFGLLLFAPYVRFRWQYPDAVTSQLSILQSYWLQPIPFAEKLARFAAQYAQGLSPQYWFAPNVAEHVRHTMQGYGNILWWTFPFFLLGFFIALKNWRDSAHRALWIALLAAPFGSALAEIGITRVLAFVIPASIFSTLGAHALIARIPSGRAQRAVTAGAFALLALVSVAMLRDALENGARWSRDYGLYGMQWGAKQIFVDALPALASAYPQSPIFISHTWANGANIFARFFPMDRSRVQIESILAFLDRRLPLPNDARFVMTREEFAVAQNNSKLKPIVVEQIIPYPDDTLGFVIGRVEYSDRADSIFAAELAAKRELIAERIELNGENVLVTHTKFDIGSLDQIFDDDIYSVARGVEINPLVLQIQFPSPRPVSALSGIFGRARIQVTAQVCAARDECATYTSVFNFADAVPGQFSGPRAEIKFDRVPARVSLLRVEILYLDAGSDAHVHVFEMKIQ